MNSKSSMKLKEQESLRQTHAKSSQTLALVSPTSAESQASEETLRYFLNRAGAQVRERIQAAGQCYTEHLRTLKILEELIIEQKPVDVSGQKSRK